MSKEYLDTVKRLEPDIHPLDMGAAIASIAAALEGDSGDLYLSDGRGEYGLGLRLVDEEMTPQMKEWNRLVEKYKPKYFAYTLRPHPNPEHVDHAFSGGLYRGDRRRFWAFTTKRSFARFGGIYNCTECLDPGATQ